MKNMSSNCFVFLKTNDLFISLSKKENESYTCKYKSGGPRLQTIQQPWATWSHVAVVIVFDNTKKKQHYFQRGRRYSQGGESLQECSTWNR